MAVSNSQASDSTFEFFIECFIGKAHVCEQGLTTWRGHFDAMENGAFTGDVAERTICVPAP